MEDAKFLFEASKLSAAGQKELVERLREFCTEEEITALLAGIGYMRMIADPQLKEAMQSAIREQLFGQRLPE